MNNWLLGVILGVLSIVVGGFALANPFVAAIATELFVAWGLIILGIVVAISAFTGEKTNGRIWTLLLGVLMLITGIAMLNEPVLGTFVLAITVGVLTMVSGIVKFVSGWKIHDNTLKWLTIISGVASFVLAILIFSRPALSLGILVAIELIFDGIALIALGFARKSGGVAA